MPDGTEVFVDLKQHAFLFGANFFAFAESTGGDEQEYRQRFKDVMNYATLPFYWHTYEPRRGEHQHERWTSAARWCQEQQIVTKGHPLVWNMEPNWLKSSRKDEKERLLWSRIADTVRRYSGLVDV